MRMMETARIYESGGGLRLETAVNEGSRRVKRLGGDDYALLKVNTPEPLAFRTGDFCDMEEGRMYVVTPPLPEYDAETGGYRYEVRLEPGYRLWGNKTLLLNPGGHAEADFRLTAGVESHVRMALRCVAHHGLRYHDPAAGEERDYDFRIGDDVTREARTVAYGCVDILTGLEEIAGAFGCELWMEGGTVCLGRCEKGDIISLERGYNVSSISASGREGKRPTRLIAFGGTENLPPYYRKRMVFTVTRREGDDIYDDLHPLRLRMLKEATHVADPSAALRTSGLGASGSVALWDGRAGEWLRLLSREVSFAEVKAGSWRLRLKDWRPKASFDTPPKGTTHQLRFRLAVSWPGRDGKREERTAESVHGYFPHADDYMPSWADMDVNLAAGGSVGLRLEIDFKPGPGGASGKAHVSSYGELGMDCYTSYCSAEGLTLEMEDGTVVEGVAFNLRHAPDTGSLPLTLPVGCPLQEGGRFMVRELRRLEVPGAWLSPEEGEEIADGVAPGRLRLPAGTPYVDSREGLSDIEAVEHVETFDDVFPRQENVVRDVWAIDSEAVNADGSRSVERYYCLDWEGMDFGEGSIIPWVDLRVRFTSGLLDGMTFGAVWHEGGIAESGWKSCLEIIASGEGGRMLPDTVLRPAAGDGIILLGVASEEVYDSLAAKAEGELLRKAVEWLEGKMTEGETYDCPLLAAAGGIPGIGQRVRLVEPSLFQAGDFVSRVIGLDYALDIPMDSPVVTVGERIPAGRLEGVEERVRELGSLGGYEKRDRQVYDVMSGITADLTNESDSVVFNALGAAVGELPETSAAVWADGEPVPGVEARVVGEYRGLGFTVQGSSVRVTSADMTMDPVTAVRIEARFRHSGAEQTRELVFRLIMRRGEHRFQLMPSASAVHVRKDGGLVPESGALGCSVLMTGSGAPAVLSESEMLDAGLAVGWSLDGSLWAAGLPEYGPGTERVVFRLMQGDACLDMETVPFVRDGADGKDGGDALVMDLDNEMATVVCDADGAVTAGLPVETRVSMFRGVKALPLEELAASAPPGVDVAADRESGLVSVTGIDAGADDVLQVEVTARAGGEERTARLTVAKSRKAVIYGLTPDPAVIKRGFTRQVRAGVTRSRGSYVEQVMTPLPEASLWVRKDEGAWEEMIPGGTIDADGVENAVSIHLCEGKAHDTSRLLDAETVAAVGDGKPLRFADLTAEEKAELSPSADSIRSVIPDTYSWVAPFAVRKSSRGFVPEKVSATVTRTSAIIAVGTTEIKGKSEWGDYTAHVRRSTAEGHEESAYVLGDEYVIPEGTTGLSFVLRRLGEEVAVKALPFAVDGMMPSVSLDDAQRLVVDGEVIGGSLRGEDAYVVEAYTLTGDKIKNGEGSTDLYARVLKGGAVVEGPETAESERQFVYTWRKYNMNGVATDWAGTSSPDKAGNPVRVSAGEIMVKATFRCTVTRI